MEGGGRSTCPPPKILEKIFFGQMPCKIWAFSANFGNFVKFSGKNHVKFRHLINFSRTYFRAKMYRPLTELLRLW